MLAPITLFVYNRPWHTRKTLESLMKNELANQSVLYIYSDGVRNKDDREEIKNIQAVRQLIQEKKWCKEVYISISDNNKGLANSIIDGVTEIVNKHGKIIVLEDDMISAKYFLKFMNDALSLYENEEDVVCVSGYVLPIQMKELFLIKGADIWGWGTWKRGWDLFEADGKKLLKELTDKKLVYRFNINGSLNCIKILEQQIEGKNDSWGIRWYASAFLKNKLHLHSPKSLIKNIGFDGSGTHCGNANVEDSEILDIPIEVTKIEVEENQKALQLIEKYNRKINNKNTIKIFKKKIVLCHKFIFNLISASKVKTKFKEYFKKLYKFLHT